MDKIFDVQREFQKLLKQKLTTQNYKEQMFMGYLNVAGDMGQQNKKQDMILVEAAGALS